MSQPKRFLSDQIAKSPIHSNQLIESFVLSLPAVNRCNVSEEELIGFIADVLESEFDPVIFRVL